MHVCTPINGELGYTHLHPLTHSPALLFVFCCRFSHFSRMSATSVPKVDARAEERESACFTKIDLGGLNPQARGRSLVVEDVGDACRRRGCFKVVNHGISKSVIAGALEAASGFFALSKEEKDEFASDDVRRPVRYGVCTRDPADVKPRDFLKMYAHPLGDWINLWPHSPSGYREKMGEFAVEVRRVALQLTDAILESLGLGPAYMKDELEEGMQVIAVNNYEKCSQVPGSMIGLEPHTDFGCITILLESCEGLQVIDGGSNTWRAVPVDAPDALHVHLGDYMEVVSNGRYKSLAHRVILDCEKRVSIASIHGFSMDEMVTAAEELVGDQHPRGYKGSRFRDFLSYVARNDFTTGSSYIDSLRIVNPST